MKTQRLNAYYTGDKTVYYIEQYNENIQDWFTVGDTYDLADHAMASIEHHNMVELLHKLDNKN